jgi:hypothetical protein
VTQSFFLGGIQQYAPFIRRQERDLVEAIA